MKEIVGIRFKKTGKIYFFNPNGFELLKNQYAVVETSRGIELGEVVVANRKVNDEKIVAPLKDVIRVATAEDVKIETIADQVYTGKALKPEVVVTNGETVLVKD